MARSIWCVLAGVVALGAAVPAQAQLWPLRLRQNGLTGGDMDVANAATKGLFAADATPGMSLPWDNPRTGNSGFATFESTTTFRKLPCRRITYVTDLVRPKRTDTYRVTWCQTANGTWKTAPN